MGLDQRLTDTFARLHYLTPPFLVKLNYHFLMTSAAEAGG